MARPALLPLPHDQDAALKVGVAPLLEQHPLLKEGRQSTRPFCAAFLRLVHSVTGQVYGAITYRKLIRIYAPAYRPATQTIDLEVKILRHELSDPVSSSRRPNLKAIRACDQPPVSEADPDLSRVQSDEIARLWGQLQQQQQLLQEADRVRVEALAAAAAAQARAETEQAARRDLEAAIERLTERMQIMQIQSDSVQKQARLHVDQVRGETRLERESRERVEQQLNRVRHELSNANELINALRQQLNSQRQKLREHDPG